jgi:uncharacterized membrane protein
MAVEYAVVSSISECALRNFIKQNMIAGLLVIIPIGLTYIVMAFVIGKLDKLMAPVVTWIILRLQIPLPEDFHLPGLGFILICFFIFIVGLVTANFLGKQLVRAWDYLMHQVPFVRGIYKTIQKVVVTISRPGKSPFKQMVLVRYPHPSSRMIGLISCDEHGEVTSRTGEDLVNVFLPLLPNVTLGFMLILPRDQIVPLKMTREEGIKYLMSFGIVVPGMDLPKEPA